MPTPTPYEVLTDEEFDARVSMETAVETIRDAVAAHGRGALDAPSRFHLDAEDGALVFTVGLEHETDVMGFRVYETLPDSPDDHQLVATWDAASGAFEGLIVGHRVGAVRTGAIGGVAVDQLAREDARTLGVLGSGRQARTQLAAAAVVRDLETVRVYSPTAAHRETFAREQAAELGLDITAVDDAETAVRGADIVVAATASREPVFAPEWLDDGVHVSTVGPKFTHAHELDPAVADDSDVIVTDSLAQVDNYEAAFFLDETPHRERMSELGQLVTGHVQGREHDEERTLYCSVGLAGTEVALAHAAFRVDQRSA